MRVHLTKCICISFFNSSWWCSDTGQLRHVQRWWFGVQRINFFSRKWRRTASDQWPSFSPHEVSYSYILKFFCSFANKLFFFAPAAPCPKISRKWLVMSRRKRRLTMMHHPRAAKFHTSVGCQTWVIMTGSLPLAPCLGSSSKWCRGRTRVLFWPSSFPTKLRSLLTWTMLPSGRLAIPYF